MTKHERERESTWMFITYIPNWNSAFWSFTNPTASLNNKYIFYLFTNQNFFIGNYT